MSDKEMTMVERVARASYYSAPRNKPFEQLSAAKRMAKLAAARESIRAMYEPNEVMMKAAVEAGVPRGYALAAIVSMIDAALNEKES
ncbi:MAG: hypothetical protein H5U22_06290 [Rhizobium sp.]|nr:hypothetical protein [Rhizobium sp.]